ncbi:MFS transporter [Okibacterium endophyticum]
MTTPGEPLWRRALVLGGIVLLALNMRTPIVAVSAVLDRVVADLSLSAATAGLLTAIPVLAFSVATPFLAMGLRRVGPDAAVLVTLIGITAGTVLRSSGGAFSLLAGTIVIGVSIALGNILVPVLIRRNFPVQRRAGLTGLYTAALNLGSVLSLVATVPVADALGWGASLNVWIGFALLAAIVWVVAVGWRRALRPRPISDAIITATGSLRVPLGSVPAQTRRRIVMLSIAFAAQSFSYYGLTAWLPQILGALTGADSTTAAAGSAPFQVFAVVSALTVGPLSQRLRYVSIVGGLALCWLMVPLGLLLAPDLWPVWISFGGLGQGGVFTLVLIVLVQVGRSDEEVGRFSAIVQGTGYAVAATGPTAIGLLHDATGGWIASLIALLIAVVVLSGFAMAGSARLRYRRN